MSESNPLEGHLSHGFASDLLALDHRFAKVLEPVKREKAGNFLIKICENIVFQAVVKIYVKPPLTAEVQGDVEREILTPVYDSPTRIFWQTVSDRPGRSVG